MSALIALDHPVDVNGIAIRFVPIRPATLADVQEAKGVRLRKRDGARDALIREIAPHMKPGENVGDAVEGFALVRRLTGLPFSALVQLDVSDQAKIDDFLRIAAEA